MAAHALGPVLSGYTVSRLRLRGVQTTLTHGIPSRVL